MLLMCMMHICILVVVEVHQSKMKSSNKLFELILESNQSKIASMLDLISDETWEIKAWYEKSEKYLDKKTKHLGAGMGRSVYDIGGGRVVKIAFNQFGREQNQREEAAWDDYGSSGVIMPVYDTAEDSRWIIMGMATKEATMKDLWNLFGVAPATLAYAVKGDPDSIEAIKKNLVAKKVVKLGKVMKLDMADIIKPDSWGWYKGDLKLIDYGLGHGQVHRAGKFKQF